MIIHTMQQGTPEWDAVKTGKFSASDINNLMGSKKTKYYNDYINQIVFERLTGTKVNHYVSKDMENGILLEPEARTAYELKTFEKVEQVGFIELDDWHGCSPDGLIGQDGMLQIKCPKWNTTTDYLLNRAIPQDYLMQMQFEMMCSGRKWNDYFVYHPALVDRLEPFRVYADKAIHELILKETVKAQEEVEQRIKQIKGE